jgi:hypothetical protein
MDKEIHTVSDRCERICGKKQLECFVNKKQKSGRMADMIFNKNSSIMMALGASRQMDDGEFLRDTEGESMSDACELSNWIQYLQIMHALTLSALILDPEAVEKWTEIRFPLPSEFERQINVICDDVHEARLLNFSQRGMQILSSRPIREGTVFQCRLVADGEEDYRNPFMATAMYCIPVEGSYMCGARLSDMHGSGVFNFFSRVHQLMMDYNRRAIVATA